LELGESDPAEEKCERGRIEGKKARIGAAFGCGKRERVRESRERKKIEERDRKKACG